MSDTLIGVLLGGILAGAVPFVTLIIESRKWKFDLRLSHLQNKRNQKEEKRKGILDLIQKWMDENLISSELYTEMNLYLPEKANKRFNEYLESLEAKADIDKKLFYWEINQILREEIREIDSQIDNLILGKGKR